MTAAIAAMWLTACGGGGGGGDPVAAAPAPGTGVGTPAPAPGTGAPAPAQALSWTQTGAAAQPYHTVSMDANGTMMLAGGNSGEMMMSMDGGDSWTPQSTSATPLPTGRWVASDVEASGGTALAAVFGGGVYRWTSAAGWAEVDAAFTGAGGRAYESVAVAQGTAVTHMLTAVQNGPVRYSADGGNTWADAVGTPSPAMWRAVDIAGDTAVAVNHDGGLYVSSNGGATFTTATVEVDGAVVTDGWYRVALSGDGNTIVVVGNQRWATPHTGIYVGRRADAASAWTWTRASTVVGEYGAVAANADGSVLVASLYAPTIDGGAPGQVLASRNGAPFAAVTAPSASESNYRAIAINGAATRLLVGAGEFAVNGFTGVPGNVYVSSGTIGQ